MVIIPRMRNEMILEMSNEPLSHERNNTLKGNERLSDIGVFRKVVS